jgi:hypothetical protein
LIVFQRGTLASMPGMPIAIAMSGSADLQAERLPVQILTLERLASGRCGSLPATSSSGRAPA